MVFAISAKLLLALMLYNCKICISIMPYMSARLVRHKCEFYKEGGSTMQDKVIEQKAGIFEPPVKPKLTKAMKLAWQKAQRSLTNSKKIAWKNKRDVLKEQFKNEKDAIYEQYHTDVALLQEQTLDQAEQKQALKKLKITRDAAWKNRKDILGAEFKSEKESIFSKYQTDMALLKEEQKTSWIEEKARKTEQYAIDKVLWRVKPELTAEEIAAHKSRLAEKKSAAKERRAEVRANAAKERASIMEAYAQSEKTPDDRLARDLAIRRSKDAQYNAKLDTKEEIRFSKDQMEKAICSPAKRYSLKKRRALYSAIWRDRWLYVMIFPFILYFLLFYYLPMPGIVLAFKEYRVRKGIWASPWADNNGMANFITFFKYPYAWRLVRNTLVMNVYLIIFGFPIPIILALMLNEVRNKMFKTTIQTLSYLPYFVSTVVVTSLIIQFLAPSGLINFIYMAVTGAEKGVYFLLDPKYFRTIYVIMDIWKGAGFGSIIYVSALVSVDAELYEAARIDGAGRWRQLLSITLPSILPTIAIMLIMRLGNILNLGYEAILLLYQPTTWEVADVISTYVYRIGMQGADYGVSTAVGLLNSVVAFIMVYITNTVSRKTTEVGLW